MIGVGVIGYGYWGPNLVRNFSETPGCRVVAVSDMRPARLDAVRGRYPAVRTTTDFYEVINAPDVDAVLSRFFGRDVDIQRSLADRDWLEAQIDLEQFAGQSVQILFKTFQTDTQGCDWNAWSDPRIVTRSTIPP